jgi:hypothetical protein
VVDGRITLNVTAGTVSGSAGFLVPGIQTIAREPGEGPRKRAIHQTPPRWATARTTFDDRHDDRPTPTLARPVSNALPRSQLPLRPHHRPGRPMTRAGQ